MRQVDARVLFGVRHDLPLHHCPLPNSGPSKPAISPWYCPSGTFDHEGTQKPPHYPRQYSGMIEVCGYVPYLLPPLDSQFYPFQRPRGSNTQRSRFTPLLSSGLPNCLSMSINMRPKRLACDIWKNLAFMSESV